MLHPLAHKITCCWFVARRRCGGTQAELASRYLVPPSLFSNSSYIATSQPCWITLPTNVRPHCLQVLLATSAGQADLSQKINCHRDEYKQKKPLFYYIKSPYHSLLKRAWPVYNPVMEFRLWGPSSLYAQTHWGSLGEGNLLRSTIKNVKTQISLKKRFAFFVTLSYR